MSTPGPSPTLTLLQACEAAINFFHPSLNQHGLTEQQWRIIRTLCRQDEMESYQLASQAYILRPNMTDVLAHLKRDSIVRCWKAPKDQRWVYVNLTEKDQQYLVSMSGDTGKNYQRIQEWFGEEELTQLLELFNELKKIKP